MKVAITTPAGHVGSSAAECLLTRGGHDGVRLLGRRPKRMGRFVLNGAEIVVGSQDDAEYLTDATRDIDALLWITPPGFGSDHVRAYQNRFGRAAAAAIGANRISRVVNISALGAQARTGVGPVNGLHDVEGLLNDAARDIIHLRPAFLFENVLWHVEAMRQSGVLSLPIAGSTRFPMIAAGDVGQIAAERLVNPSWSGQSVCELHGPADLSLEEVAETLSQATDRKISYVRSEPFQHRRSLLEHGLSEDIADLLLEWYDAIDTGRLQAAQTRSPETTTPTTFARFAREVIAPLLTEEPVGR